MALRAIHKPVESARRAGAVAGSIGQVVLGLAPWVPAPRPHDGAALRPDWLTRQLGEQVPGAAVDHIEVLDGTTGTTDRLRLALRWNETGRAASLPASVFVKSTSRSPKNRTMVGALWMAVNEVKFYGTARAELGDVAPEAYVAHAGVGARFLLVLEDLVARGARPFGLGDDCDLAHARAMMRTLADVHATFWESPRFATDLAWAAPVTRRPGMTLLAFQFRRVRRKMLESPERFGLPPAVRRLARVVNDHDDALYRRWERGSLTLLHGDSHLGNTYALPDGRAGLLDWQVVFRGPGVREVAYFLATSAPTHLRREHERALLRVYIDTLRENGVDAPSFDAAWDDYRFFVYDAWDSAAITVLWPGLQPSQTVARSFERATAAVVDLEVDKAVEHALR